MFSIRSLTESSWGNKGLWIAGALAVAGAVVCAVSYFFKKDSTSSSERSPAVASSPRQAPKSSADQSVVAAASSSVEGSSVAAKPASLLWPFPPGPGSEVFEQRLADWNQVYEKYNIGTSDKYQLRNALRSLQAVRLRQLNGAQVANYREVMLHADRLQRRWSEQVNQALTTHGDVTNYVIWLRDKEDTRAAVPIDHDDLNAINIQLNCVGEDLVAIEHDLGPLAESVAQRKAALRERLLERYNQLKARQLALGGG